MEMVGRMDRTTDPTMVRTKAELTSRAMHRAASAASAGGGGAGAVRKVRRASRVPRDSHSKQKDNRRGSRSHLAAMVSRDESADSMAIASRAKAHLLSASMLP